MYVQVAENTTGDIILSVYQWRGGSSLLEWSPIADQDTCGAKILNKWIQEHICFCVAIESSKHTTQWSRNYYVKTTCLLRLHVTVIYTRIYWVTRNEDSLVNALLTNMAPFSVRASRVHNTLKLSIKSLSLFVKSVYEIGRITVS